MQRILHKILRAPYFLESLEIALVSCAFVLTEANMQSLTIGGWIAVLGLSLYTWAAGFRNKDGDGQLTFGGPYRFLRYPIVLSRFLLVLGLILVSRTPFFFIVAVVGLAPLYRQLMRQEDAWMRAELGPLAAEYRVTVSGFIPQFLPTKLSGFCQVNPSVRFSWARALWQSPGRASNLMATVCAVLVSQYVWVERILLDWQWRLGAAAFVALGAGFLGRNCGLYRQRG